MCPNLFSVSPLRRPSIKRCNWLPGTIFLLLSLMLAGCNLGPQQLRGNRFDYNVSIQTSDNQELLLNLVRLRYSEVPCFMQVSSITASFEYSLALQASGQLAKGDLYTQFPQRMLSPLIRGGYSENPTISYTPLAGEKFVSQLLTPVNPHRFWFLHRSGWEIDLLLDLLVTRIGALNNPDPYEYKDPKALEAGKRFQEFAQLLREYQVNNNFALVLPTDEQKNSFSLLMELRFKHAGEAKTFETFLGEKLNLTSLPDGSLLCKIFLSDKGGFSELQAKHLKEPILRVRFRNFIGVLVNLVNGVKAPRSEVEEGVARRHGESLEEISLSRIARIVVNCASTFPANAYIGIKYRGHCFFISDQDFVSKRIFSFVATLLALQSGDVKSTPPVLTLPVGSPR